MSIIKPDNEAPSNVTGHPYTPPEGRPFGRCAYEGCGLGESVHSTSNTVYLSDPNLAWRCPNCVTLDIDPCPHTRKNWEEYTT